jgi:hypothetical protein
MTLYETLSVAPDASQAQIKRAWRDGMKQNHPDVGGTAADAMRIQAAYDVLGDPTRRAAYDKHLAESAPPGADQQLGDLIAKILEDLVETLAREVAQRLAEVLAEAWRSEASTSRHSEDVPERLLQLRDRTGLACNADTASGHPCLRSRTEQTVYCWQHLAQLRSGDLAPTRFADGRPQCGAMTQGGTRCRSTAIVGGLCHRHGGQAHQPVRRLSQDVEPRVPDEPHSIHAGSIFIVLVAVLVIYVVIVR